MRNDYGIEPEQHHSASVVDLLGRSCRLKEAANFIDKMPVEPSWVVWNALLGACRVHGDVELGRLAFKKVVTLEPHDSGAYIFASNISAEGDWEEVVKFKGGGQYKKGTWLEFCMRQSCVCSTHPEEGTFSICF